MRNWGGGSSGLGMHLRSQTDVHFLALLSRQVDIDGNGTEFELPDGTPFTHAGPFITADLVGSRTRTGTGRAAVTVWPRVTAGVVAGACTARVRVAAGALRV